jgi:hypothetical protein
MLQPEALGEGMMTAYGRWLFGLAALFNAAVGALALLAPELFAAWLGLDAITGTNRLFAALSGGFILLFGYAYLRIALDAARFRAFIGFGAAGKLSAVAIIAGLWLRHVIGPTVPALAGGDVIFALLFVDYLRRTKG